MVDMSSESNVDKKFEEEMMWRIVPRIATMEIPVTNLERSMSWYCKVLGVKGSIEMNKQQCSNFKEKVWLVFRPSIL
ncbi:VOC family protein [Bacillus solitudinis]|uniref:VOC family protein n=1 Tax=Bacillus solitudinis TaxID=2014074 RepID=UPI000C23773D|nr:hypothetical protein [Bacillus solitudinis]